ncbi:MAG TPA: hypothetical protein VFN31_00855 [Candidatus Saccharimonadales bacterium]|nr:hypothetical protein [Candidatus Saccharimonadales bacterium]
MDNQPIANNSQNENDPNNINVISPIVNTPATPVAPSSVMPAVVVGGMVGGNSPEPVANPPRSSRRKLAISALCLILLVAIGGLTWYLTHKNSGVSESGTSRSPYGTISGSYSGPAYPAYTAIGNVNGRNQDTYNILSGIFNYISDNQGELPAVASNVTNNKAWNCASITSGLKLSVYSGAVISNCYAFNIQKVGSIKSLAPGFYASSVAQSAGIKISPYPADISNDALILEEGRTCDDKNSYQGTSNDTVVSTDPLSFVLLTTQENALHKYMWNCNGS